ncbi:hypothetical protein HJC99_01865 [Candidatus Saccharibacteria bacterium]|nr:hypothetical protein [Candidatus Saccharibacteria bacterium]
MAMFVAVLVLMPSHQSAQADVGPDGSYYMHGTLNPATIYYSLELSDSVTATRVEIPIYLPGLPSKPPTSNTTINLSYDTGPGHGGNISFTAGTRVVGGFNPGSVTIPPGAARGNWVYDANSKMWKAFVVGTLQPVYNTNYNFRISSTTGGSRVGYSTGNGSQFSLNSGQRCANDFGSTGPYDQRGCNNFANPSDPPGVWGKYYDYVLPFAPPCTQKPTARKVSITLYDPDDPSGTTARTGTQPAPFTVVLMDVTPGFLPKSVALSKVVKDAPPGTPGATYSFPNPLASDNKSTEYLSFQFVKTHKYVFHVNNVYVNNVLQFSLPFDSIYAQVPCINAFANTATLSADQSSINAGVTTRVTWTAQADVTAANTYTWHTSSSTYPTVVTTAGPSIDGTSYAATAAGFQPPVTYYFDFTPSLATPNGTSLCSTLSISPTSNVNTSDNPAVPPSVCVTVNNPKIPLVTVTGDVHAGAISGSACTLAPVTGNIRTNVGSLGREVVSASGSITNFASNNSVATLGAPAIDSYPVCKSDLASETDDYLTSGQSLYTMVAPPPCRGGVGSLNLASLPAAGAGAQQLMVVNCNLTLSGSTSHSVTIYMHSGVLTIGGNVLVAGSAVRTNQPGVGIISNGTINIAPAATTVDAFVYSGGTINTCAPIASGCNSVLQVNGILLGGHILLNRYGVGVGGTQVGENIEIAGQLYLNPPPIFGLSDAFTNYYNGDGELSPRY